MNGIHSGEWTDFDRAQMKQYILAFAGSEYDIWVLCARLSEDSSTWDGCSVTNIYRSMCTSKVGVRRLKSWINEIHRWSLSVHAAGCQTDVKTILGDNDIENSSDNLGVGEYFASIAIKRTVYGRCRDRLQCRGRGSYGDFVCCFVSRSGRRAGFELGVDA